MKTYRNRHATKHLLLVRDWDEDTGRYTYAQRQLTDEALTAFRSAEADEEYFEFSRTRDLLPHREWYGLLAPLESLTVETSRETFHQCAMRTGDFSRWQVRRVS